MSAPKPVCLGTGRVCYLSRQEANAAKAEMAQGTRLRGRRGAHVDHVALQVYRCEDCGHIHLGTERAIRSGRR